MTRLLLDFDAFFLEHRLCGEIDAGVDGAVVWITCECGAKIAAIRRKSACVCGACRVRIGARRGL